ncbi:ABC transporter ATP-binding protein [Plantactinospora sp. GCM10030261]|uniref:ABC transporter ATP-binding protein n=1 Tax=Plantactinospora sp. GCM10030261 TaxID=3273420 RepID=UPI003608791B
MDVTPETGSAAPHSPRPPSAAPITLEHIRKQYPDGTVAVTDLSLEIKAGELVVLIGPSGCGKSTVLRMINRLIEPTSGRILLGDEDVTAVDPVQLRRRMGYVIQNVGLFPHQTIRTNIGTVPRLLGWSSGRIRERADELLELVGLDPATFSRRYPHELSGGQRQRVGVARALAADPVVLLMDEPFSAVDPIARTRLQEEFLRLQAEVRKTIVLVTHDLDEAVRLGDRIAILSQGGSLEQYDSPAALLGEPASAFVREFVGADRGIRRLAVTPITRELLDDAELVDHAGLPSATMGSSLYDALAKMLVANADYARVLDDDKVIGLLSRHRVLSIDYPAETVD